MSGFQLARFWCLSAVAVLAAAAAGCGPVVPVSPSGSPMASQPPVIALPTTLPDVLSFQDALPLFEYDRTVAMNITQVAVYPRGDATLTDLTYTGVHGVAMPAYLVTPAGQGPFAAVLWMGWTGGAAHSGCSRRAVPVSCPAGERARRRDTPGPARRRAGSVQ